MAYNDLASAMAIPSATLVAQSWIGPDVHMIRTCGYASQGDGGDSLWIDYGTTKPPHQCFLGPSQDGRYWGPGQPWVDPRALGAPCNTVVFGDGAIDAGSVSRLSIGDYTFSNSDIGKPICVTKHLGIFPGPGSDAVTNTVFTVISGVVAGTGTCLLAASIPAAATQLSGWFGNDDAAAINAVLSASGTNFVNPQNINAPFMTNFLGTGLNQWQIGTIGCYFRNWAVNQGTIGAVGFGRNRALYSAASSINFISGSQIRFDKGVKLIANPAWVSGVAPLGQALMQNAGDGTFANNPLSCWFNSFEDLYLDGMGMTPKVFWFINGQFPGFKGLQQISQPLVTGGTAAQIGPGTNAYGGSVFNSRGVANWVITAPSSSLATYLGNTAIGFQWAASASDNRMTGNIDIAGFATGYDDEGGDNSVLGDVHPFTSGAFGYMPIAAKFASSGSYVSRLVLDTPCSPNAVVPGVPQAQGLLLAGADATFGEVYLVCNNSFRDNAGAALISGNTDGIVVNSLNPGNSRTVIGTLKATRSNSNALWANVVNASTSNGIHPIQINDFNGDGNWQSLGYTDWKKIQQKGAAVNSLSLLSLLTQANKGASGSQLWTPAELGSQVAFWFDASLPTWSLDKQPINNVYAAQRLANWHSRSGTGLGIQTGQAEMPIFNTGAWSIGSGFQGASGQVDFDGANDWLQLFGGNDPPFPPNVNQSPYTSMYVFCVMIAQNQGSAGYVASIGGTSWTAQQSFNGTTMNWGGVNGGAGSMAFTANAPMLTTGIWSGAASTNGATGRVNGADNAAAGSLGATPGTEVTVGAINHGSTGWANMTIAEMVIVFGTLTDGSHTSTTAQTRLVEGYLAWKWGIQASMVGGWGFSGGAPTA